MNDLTKWIKKNWIRIAIISIVLFIAFPLLIDLVYKKGDITPLYKTKLSPSDILAYIGAFFSFAGTVALGFLALWQNQKIEENNDQFQKIQEEHIKKLLKIQKDEKRPLLVADKIINLEFKQDVDFPEYVKADFSYELKLIDGVGFGYIAQVIGGFFFDFDEYTINKILTNQDPTEGGFEVKLNDEKQFITNDLNSEGTLLTDNICLRAKKEIIKKYAIMILQINITYSDIYNYQNIDKFYFAFQKKSLKGFKLFYKNYYIRR